MGVVGGQENTSTCISSRLDDYIYTLDDTALELPVVVMLALTV